MSYYIQENEPLPTAFTRITAEQVAKARTALYDQEHPARAVHKARKHFKKIRALVRLVRLNLGEPEYQAQNIYYRDLGRQLSPLRDATSLLESLDMLKSRFGDQLQPDSFQQLTATLLEDRRTVREQAHAEDDPVRRVIAELDKADEYIARLKIDPEGWDDLLNSNRKVYKRGYKAYRKSFEPATLDELHEWRKRSKYLWYHYRLLKRSWKPVLDGFARETHHLSDLLGDHRDLALLQIRINEISDRIAPHTRQVITGIASEWQATLLHDAQALGRKLYAESPDDFRNRMNAYVDRVTS